MFCGLIGTASQEEDEVLCPAATASGLIWGGMKLPTRWCPSSLAKLVYIFNIR